MLKKALYISFLFFFGSLLFTSSMVLTVDAYPTSVSLSWNNVEGTTYYDIYNNNDFVVRLDSNTLNYNVEKLASDTEYTFSIAARDSKNNTLAAARAKITTDSWDGVYKWVNKSDDANKRRLSELILHVETKMDDEYGQFYAIKYIDSSQNEIQIFPLFDFDDKAAFEWHKYKEDSIAGNSYRINAELFNTSPFKPGKWKVYSIVIDSNCVTAYIQTSAIGMEFLTTTVFKFYEDESGLKHLSLDTKGEQKIVDNYLFKNPNPGEGDAFILDKIS